MSADGYGGAVPSTTGLRDDMVNMAHERRILPATVEERLLTYPALLKVNMTEQWWVNVVAYCLHQAKPTERFQCWETVPLQG